ncbi:HAD hydrolase [Gloeophyllum trabeum ATCC 11539]|uniref:HAD hydrolase n=1 Tax=Gloeophyllum trabeum (strain ATCC 11539 / FP-39264 / Madison 617) TaxID=670483 RepID=S7Q5C6_GLOTA|nr:HAD hydrolase [Gloeophyllum trabeum ATCC 11539]EPQ54702.1 HAD hydrolase [Gloeophyllum trabeum ATCC 11539]
MESLRRGPRFSSIRLHCRALAQPRRCFLPNNLRVRTLQTHSRSSTASRQQPHPPLVFAFDIDGVLLRGETVLPAAKRALARLEGANPTGLKIPYILITNGGGISEEDRCRKLSKQLGFDIKPTQYVQSHTVLKSVVHKYAEKPIMVFGGKFDEVRKVAEGYGFEKVYTTLDVMAWNPNVWPFHELTAEERASTKPVDFSRTPISAAFVFHDPRNWALDVQILCDLVQSGGIIGAPYLPVSEQNKVDLVFCNPDLLWRAAFDRPRLGQGAFREAFQAVYHALTGKRYPYVQYGKPSEVTYKFAEKVLVDRLEELSGRRPAVSPEVYMVGDNPESDIAGANAAKWSSVLVRTGVFDPAQGPPAHTPTHIAEDVEEAVEWAIRREMERAG